jgi:L-threonylcarbamoyladenylate synthase
VTTAVLPIDPTDPEAGAIRRAAAVIQAGGLVAFPTETVYGLGTNALDAAAVARIFEAKGRPSTNPVIVHVADTAQVLNVAAEWPETAERLAARFWPGPLTIVVPRWPGLPDVVTAGGPTVAVRRPDHPVAAALIREAGVPVAAPSANRSTELSPTRAEHVLKGLDGRIDLILDGGPCPGGIESTVVDVTGGVVRLLRPGLITVPMLEEVCGKVELASRERPDAAARSPGRMAKHYSPRTPLVLVSDQRAGLKRVDEVRATGRCAWLLTQSEEGIKDKMECADILSAEPDRYAAELYNVLHMLDGTEFEDGSTIDVIVAVLPPDTPEWAAVRDRLMRAAAGSSAVGERGA